MKIHVAAGRVGQRTEIEKTIGNGKEGKWKGMKMLPLTGMQMHVERCQKKPGE